MGPAATREQGWATIDSNLANSGMLVLNQSPEQSPGVSVGRLSRSWSSAGDPPDERFPAPRREKADDRAVPQGLSVCSRELRALTAPDDVAELTAASCPVTSADQCVRFAAFPYIPLHASGQPSTPLALRLMARMQGFPNGCAEGEGTDQRRDGAFGRL